MPPVIARELLEGTPLEALARSYPSATIAFVALEEYSTKVSTTRIWRQRNECDRAAVINRSMETPAT